MQPSNYFAAAGKFYINYADPRDKYAQYAKVNSHADIEHFPGPSSSIHDLSIPSTYYFTIRTIFLNQFIL